MEFIFGLAHRIVVMDQGRVLMTGTPDEVRDDPRVLEVYLGG
jgi:branched-chain amino acid transport system ATP-binding protein